MGVSWGFARVKSDLGKLSVGMFALVMAGCAVQRYRPVAVAPAQTASSLESRTLQDDGLRQFITKALGQGITWPPNIGDLRFLTLAAFYFNPDLAVARAQVEIAKAGIKTARMRPNPILDFSPGIPSPYLIGLSLAFPIVTAGKRGYEIELAKNLNATAELNLAALVWKVRSRVRSALLSYIVAEHNRNLAQSAERLWQTRATRLYRELAVGEISKPELETSRTALLDAQLGARAAEGRVAQAEATLAAAIGIPVSGIDGVRLDWPNLDQVPSLTVLTSNEIQRDAVLNRLDVRRALADYTAAQNSLQLEIARRVPNFQLGPGYQYEESHSFFGTSLAIELPVFNRNEGPIAQAEAHRSEAAANLLVTQANVIAESEQGLAQYRANFEVLQVAQTARENFQRVQVPMAQRAVTAGESDWLSLNSVLLQSSAAAKAWIDSVFQAQASLGQLEDAVQKPLEPEDSTPLVLRVPEDEKRPKE
jgi:outer membrane protein TolC